MIRLSFLFLIISFFPTALYAERQADWKNRIQSLVQNGTVLAVSEKGQALYQLNIDKPFVPASTLKVATALTALYHLGENFRFKTDIYLDRKHNLYIKGYGDPFIVSEEMARLAKQLKKRGLKKVNNIYLDTSFYGDTQVHGRSNTLNPYDAQLSALVANFNTIYVKKDRSGRAVSAEPQTPTTEITSRLARRAPVGKSRVSLTGQQNEAVLYFGYLLKEFLKQQFIQVNGELSLLKVPSSVRLFLSYENSKSLQEILRSGLKYSQNLIMNQIFLMYGAKKLGTPASLAKGRQVMKIFLKERLKLKNFSLEEGSGLSRKNRFTAIEMDKILVGFFPYRELLPVKHNMWVKTGTLRGVACLVGYFKSQKHGWVRFVILLNQSKNYRDQIARLLYQNL